MYAYDMYIYIYMYNIYTYIQNFYMILFLLILYERVLDNYFEPES